MNYFLRCFADFRKQEAAIDESPRRGRSGNSKRDYPVSKTTQRIEKVVRWPPRRAARKMLPTHPDLTAAGARRPQGRCLSPPLWSAASEGKHSLHVLPRGDKQCFYVHLLEPP